MKHTFGILIASCAVALMCAPARGGTILSVVPATIPANAGDVGDGFDVVLTNSSGGSNITVGIFALEVSVTDPDITLTGAAFSTVAFPYIFAGQSFDQANSLPLNTDSGQTLDASDSYNTSGSGVTLTPGTSLSLGYVMFNVANGAAPGPFSVSFTGTPTQSDANNLSDPSFNAINIDTFSGGTIDISGSNAVPEPSSLLLMLAGAGAFAGWGRRRLA